MNDKARPEYKIHEPAGGNTRDLTVRVSAIANGYVVKAGGAPFYCETPAALSAALSALADDFTKSADFRETVDTAKKKRTAK